ncbi:MAG: DUF5681 domain-containing protein [Pseudomonadota bacterium]
MSGRDPSSFQGSNLPVPYEVGYAKPPAEHRFAKGRSGNPRGRPKGAKNKPTGVNTDYGRKPTEDFLLMEAYRPVTIREGEQVIQLPAIQAVFRAMGVAAMKGNRLAQKTLAEMVERTEATHHQSKYELFSAMFDYKKDWSAEVECCEKLGLPDPQPIPHPDDLVLDFNTGDVKFLGPKTREEKQRLDGGLARRDQAQEEVNYFAEKYRRARSPKQRALYLSEWHWEQRMFDIVNYAVGKRYKAKLENRSYAEGASREGKALEELRTKRKLRSEYVE